MKGVRQKKITNFFERKNKKISNKRHTIDRVRVPFGIYKGKPLRMMLKNSPYTQWAIQSKTIIVKYPEFNHIVCQLNKANNLLENCPSLG